ncbi:hypothetical protein XW59_024145 [Aquamicrobium sp. LC103]|nr:hypothetical protein XW59_024145 [Aquamicrobium sp. LC103]
MDAPKPSPTGQGIESLLSARRRTHANAVERQSGRIRHSDGTSASAISQHQTSYSAGAAPRRSINDMLFDFISPDIPDPAILRESASILQHCVTNLVPTLEGGEQLRDFATALMEEEIERHQDLKARLGEGRRF